MKLTVHMIGNAHIDPVWLWNWPTGVDEALATFRSAADRCDEFPEFIYTRGEAWLYEQVEKLDPELFARVQTLVERGQWHVTGGQYLQPDANLPTLRGWERQLGQGRRYFETRFGVRPRVGYNVDSFGHPVTLPDIYAAHGYLGYVFGRPNETQQHLPGQTFRWRGTGGAELLGFRIAPAYVTRSDDLYGQIMLAADAADRALGHTMCFYGVGNHGGGPTKANITYILEHQNAFDGLELRFSTPQAFFGAVQPKRATLPVYEGELQRTFPGCYSVMHDIKQAQVRGEARLEQTEGLIDAFVTDTPDADEARAGYHQRLDAAWNDLLFTQFHDILSGTAVPSAWPSVRAMQGRARITAEELQTEVSRRWARRALPSADMQQLVVLNASRRALQGLVEAEPFLDFDTWGHRWLSDLQGAPIPYQRIQPEAPMLLSHRLLFPVTVAAGSYAQLLVRDDPPPETPAPPFETDLSASPTELSNSLVTVELTPTGLGQLRYKGAPLLGEGGLGLILRADSTDTWTFHRDRFDEPVRETFRAEAWVVEETGPLRVRARLEGRIGHSPVRWTVSLGAHDPRVSVQLEVTYCETGALLQLPVQLRSAPPSWLDAQAGGAVCRRPSPVEWPVGGFSRVSVGGIELALVTRDAYSLSLNGTRWQWTLLRSPKMAWGGGQADVSVGHDYYTDQGVHTFALTLHVGETLRVETLEAAADLHAQPPLIFDRYEGMNRPPWGNDVPRRLWTGAEQRARQDGHMAHLTDDVAKGVEEGPI